MRLSLPPLHSEPTPPGRNSVARQKPRRPAQLAVPELGRLRGATPFGAASTPSPPARSRRSAGKKPARLPTALDEEDRRRALGALAIALDPQGNGASVHWDNPVSKAHGSVTPVGFAYPSNDLICRDFQAQFDTAPDARPRQAPPAATRARNGPLPNASGEEGLSRNLARPCPLRRSGFRAQIMAKTSAGACAGRRTIWAYRNNARSLQILGVAKNASHGRSQKGVPQTRQATPSRPATGTIPRRRKNSPRSTPPTKSRRREEARPVRPRRDRRRRQAAPSGLRRLSRGADRAALPSRRRAAPAAEHFEFDFGGGGAAPRVRRGRHLCRPVRRSAAAAGAGSAAEARQGARTGRRYQRSKPPIPLETAMHGGKARVLDAQWPDARSRTSQAGIEEGKQIRLRGQGQPSPSGGPAGDALVTRALRKTRPVPHRRPRPAPRPADQHFTRRCWAQKWNRRL